MITKPGEGELGKQTEMSDGGVSRQSRDITMLQFTTQQYRHYLDVTHPAEFLLIIINLLWIVINTKNVIIFVLIPRQTSELLLSRLQHNSSQFYKPAFVLKEVRIK